MEKCCLYKKQLTNSSLAKLMTFSTSNLYDNSIKEIKALAPKLSNSLVSKMAIYLTSKLGKKKISSNTLNSSKNKVIKILSLPPLSVLIVKIEKIRVQIQV